MNLLKCVYALLHHSEPTYMLYLMQQVWATPPISPTLPASVPQLFLQIFNIECRDHGMRASGGESAAARNE